MSTTYKAYLVAGIPLNDFFRKIGEKEETFLEYDKKGNKTGNKFTETKIVATLPDGNEVVIGEKFKGDYSENIRYDFYSSLGFDGDFSDKTFLELHFDNYETTNLSNRIIGNVICETNAVEEIETVKINQIVEKVRAELKEKFSYNGIVKLYLINYVSY